MDDLKQRNDGQQQFEPLFRATGCDPPKCVGDFERKPHAPSPSGDAVMRRPPFQPGFAERAPTGTDLRALMCLLNEKVDDRIELVDHFCRCQRISVHMAVALVEAVQGTGSFSIH